MPYKDESKRKEAQRERTRRYRAKRQGVTQAEAVTPKRVTPEKRLLMKWAARDDNSYQCWLGRLALQYDVIRGLRVGYVPPKGSI